MEISSISKMRVALGPMAFPAPVSPYARLEGIKSCHFAPSFISGSASTHPAITPFTGKVAGSPREQANDVALRQVGFETLPFNWPRQVSS